LGIDSEEMAKIRIAGQQSQLSCFFSGFVGFCYVEIINRLHVVYLDLLIKIFYRLSKIMAISEKK
jgi:hypothetical protein